MGPTDSPRRNSRVGRLLAAIVLTTVAACSTAAPVGEVSAPPPTTVVASSPLLGDEPMTACSSAGVDAWCGRLPVPEDRLDLGGRMIELRVVLVPAERPAAEPDAVFFLAGGPGGAATESWASAPVLFPEIHAERDIVLVDQRGTGGSNRLLLPEPPDWSDHSPNALAGVLPEWIDAAFSELPGDYRQYTSAVAADDLDEVRRALGYESVDLYGGSYGATLAQYYLRQHPGRVRTVVLDGGTLLDVPIFELYGGRSQEVLDRLFARCEADDVCRGAYPDLDGDLAAAMRRLAARPVPTAVVDATGERIVVDDAVLARQIHHLILTHRSGEVPRLVHLAARGRVRPVAEVIDESAFPDVTRLAMFWSIMCSEGWARFRPGPTRRHTVGSYLAGPVVEDAQSIELACRYLGPGVVTADDAEPVRSEVPVLLLNGSEDPQDPPANVADAPVELPNSLAVTVRGQGHTVGHLGCLPEMVAAFIAAGTVEALDTGCVAEFGPPPFVIRSF